MAEPRFDWSSIAPGDEHYQLALGEYHAGRSFSEIVAILERKGLAPELIPEVTSAVAKDRVLHLLLAGKPATEARGILVERGLSQEDAHSIVRTVEGSRQRAYRSVGVGKWQTRSLVAGGLLLTVGLALYCLRRFIDVDVPSELVIGVVGSGVLLAGVGGLYIAFGMR